MNAGIISGLFVTGVVFGSGPCLASCGPVLVSYVAATKKNALSGVAAYLFFSLSRSAVYMALGLLIFISGRFFLESVLNNISSGISIITGVLVVFFGLMIALGGRADLFCPGKEAFLKNRILAFLQEKIFRKNAGSMVTFGAMVGLLPCAPLLAVLSYVAMVSHTPFQSIVYSASFGAGTVISPLLLLAAAASFVNKMIVGRKDLYYRVFNVVCGSIIIFFGLRILRRGF